MRRLFVRLFVFVWVSMTLSGAAFVVIEATADPPLRRERRRALLRHGIIREAELAARDVAAGDDPSPRLSDFRERTDATIFLFAPDGRTFGPAPPSDAARRLAARVEREGDRDIEKESAIMAGFLVEGTDVIAVGRLPRTPPWARALGTDTLVPRLLVILGVSGLVAWLLARYVARPIEQLRRAARRIADGDLSVRVLPELPHADAETQELARDFDVMAERVEGLLVSQQQLLSDVAHELNSPLARLRVGIELARTGASPTEKTLDRMEREVERLGETVEELLTLTRSDPSRLAREPTELRALVETIAADGDYEATAQKKHVRVEPGQTVTIAVDAELIRRAVENVVRNAVRFTEEGSEVTLALAVTDQVVDVTVSDRGPGVPDEALPRLFEAFFRVDPDRDRKTGGAGLGLAITERAIRLHGGNVHAENREGGGLSIRLRLPRVRDRANG